MLINVSLVGGVLTMTSARMIVISRHGASGREGREGQHDRA
jgi:hypothetical protein